MMSLIQPSFKSFSQANNTNTQEPTKTAYKADAFKVLPTNLGNKSDTVQFSQTPREEMPTIPNHPLLDTVTITPTSTEVSPIATVEGTSATLSVVPVAQEPIATTNPVLVDGAIVAPTATPANPRRWDLIGAGLGAIAAVGTLVLGIVVATRHKDEIENLQGSLTKTKQTVKDLGETIVDLQQLKHDIGTKFNNQLDALAIELNKTKTKLWHTEHKNAMHNLPEANATSTWVDEYLKPQATEGNLSPLQVLAKRLLATEADGTTETFSVANVQNQPTMQDARTFNTVVLEALNAALTGTPSTEHTDFKADVDLLKQALGTFTAEAATPWEIHPDIGSLTGAEQVAEQLKKARLENNSDDLSTATIAAYEHIKTQLKPVLASVTPAVPTATE